MTKSKRPLGLAAYVISMLATMIVAGVAGAAIAMLGDQPGAIGIGLTVAIITAAMMIGLALCIWWWRGIDEAAREAHKWAWWWGGSGGLGIGGVVLITLDFATDDMAAALFGSESNELFAAGMLSIAFFQIIGYGIAWAAWWLRHR